jgi:hypothetical protein
VVTWLDRAAVDGPVELLPDDQVLALRDRQFDATTQNELSDLVAHEFGQCVGASLATSWPWDILFCSKRGHQPRDARRAGGVGSAHVV